MCACRDKVYVALRVVISFLFEQSRFLTDWLVLKGELVIHLAHCRVLAHVPAGLQLRGEVVAGTDHLWR